MIEKFQFLLFTVGRCQRKFNVWNIVIPKRSFAWNHSFHRRNRLNSQRNAKNSGKKLVKWFFMQIVSDKHCRLLAVVHNNYSIWDMVRIINVCLVETTIADVATPISPDASTRTTREITFSVLSFCDHFHFHFHFGR